MQFSDIPVEDWLDSTLLDGDIACRVEGSVDITWHADAGDDKDPDMTWQVEEGEDIEPATDLNITICMSNKMQVTKFPHLYLTFHNYIWHEN